MKNIILLVLLFTSFTSCRIKKVHLSKNEKELIKGKKNQRYLFESEFGIIDTVFVDKAKQLSLSEEKLARLALKYIYNDKNDYGSIPFEKSFATPYSFERGKFKKEGINLSIKIIFLKSNVGENITLRIYPFEEEYILNNDPNKEYIFTKNNDYNPDLCETSVLGCLKKVIYSIERGIIFVEKGDTGIWKLVERIE